MKRMVFCNIARMVSYRGQTNSDSPYGGGSHPVKYEVHNFNPLGDEIYGYVPAVSRTINVSRIVPVGRNAAYVEGVDVVWTAPPWNHGRGRDVVGWYRNATVFRHLQSYERGEYQIKARAADCRLLPVDRRTLKIESARDRPGGFGQSPVWYAESQYGVSVRRRVLQLIGDAERQIFDRQDLQTKAAALEVGDRPPRGNDTPWRDQHQVTVVARDPEVHAWVLQTAKGRCELCGSNGPFVRRGGGRYLEIHHIDRLADGGADVPNNAVALCPNCHREAHHGVRAEAVRRELRDRVASRRQD